MNNPMLMQMLQPLTRLPTNRSNLTLRHQIGRDDVGERAALHVLHHDPELVPVQEGVDVVHDVGVARGAHDEDLVYD